MEPHPFGIKRRSPAFSRQFGKPLHDFPGRHDEASRAIEIDFAATNERSEAVVARDPLPSYHPS
jgi:hypothetical protein